MKAKAAEHIYHIAREKDWLDGLEFGEYLAASLGSEGFIHCSTRKQVVNTANRHFNGASGLVLLEIDPSLSASEIRFESSQNDLFPHIYGPINLDAVVDVFRFLPDAVGKFHFPGKKS